MQFAMGIPEGESNASAELARKSLSWVWVEAGAGRAGRAGRAGGAGGAGGG